MQGKTGSSSLFSIRKELALLWFYGLAGSGKTTIAQTIASWCDSLGLLGASFFCARVGGRSGVLRIFPTIAHQLSVSNPAFANEVMKALSSYPDIHRSQPLKQLQKLIVEPLRAMKDTPFFPQVIIIDALDECLDEEAVSVILVALSELVTDIHPLKFLITSRPEDRIVKGFRYDSLLRNTYSFPISQIPPEVMKKDIAIYVDSQFASIPEADETWPGNEKKRMLVTLSDGTFIFITTAFKFILDKKANDPRGQLEIVLNMQWDDKDSPLDRKSTRLNSSHSGESRMPSSA